MKTKELLLFWGWNRRDNSYQGLVELAPKGWNVSHIAYPDLIPNGDVSQLNSQVLEYLEDKGLDKVTLAGHSLGGGLAILFALEHPERVEQLYLMDCVGVCGGSDLFRDMFHAWRNDPRYKHIPKESRASLLKRILQNPFGSIRLGLLARTLDLTDQATRLEVPTALIWGENDRLTPLWKGERLHSLIPNSKLVTLKDMSHDWVIAYPKLFWQNVK